jgi:geranylgeranyl transferase type-1 subunit beta
MAGFDKPKHVRYWVRCLKTYLPTDYTAMDSNRMLLAYFTISALDLLDALDSNMTAHERLSYVNWIYAHQLPTGGFRGFPGTNMGDRATAENAPWDPANVPATYFALAMLVMLRDDFSRVRRHECLSWLRDMQREDGSFGQTLGRGGRVEGGTDTRFAYLAVCSRWFLGGDLPTANPVRDDINVDALVSCIRRLQVYDGGISDEMYHEPHGK